VVTFAFYEWVRRLDDITLIEARTAAAIALLVMGLTILTLVSRPLKPWKVGLATSMATLYGLVLAVPALRNYFVLELPSGVAWLGIVVASLVGSIGIVLSSRWFGPEQAERV